jgi:colanic acid/amylovoran biosynthesis glycosyltransferase
MYIADYKRLLKLDFQEPARREPLIVAHTRAETIACMTDLINACRTLLRRHCDFRCEIYCEASYQDCLTALVESAGLRATVKFIAASSSTQMRDAISRASVFVLVDESPADQFALVDLHEAMALGTPCLVTDYSSGAELIQDGETGIVEPRHYPDALAISLQRLLSDSSLRTRLAREARRTLETMHGAHAHEACC